MCGIIGYFGKREASDILVDGLRRMEYRGYDSAGVACLHDEQIAVVKNSGKIKDLRRLVDQTDSSILRSKPGDWAYAVGDTWIAYGTECASPFGRSGSYGDGTQWHYRKLSGNSKWIESGGY